jgi:hypothetical protein
MMEFDNPVGFLRARACWVYAQFSDIKLKCALQLLGGGCLPLPPPTPPPTGRPPRCLSCVY